MKLQPFDMATALGLIKSGEADALRKLICGDADTKSHVFAGGQVRAIVAAIALAVRPGRDLMELALDFTAPWVDTVSLCEMVDMMIPRAGITELGPSVDEEDAVASMIMNGEFLAKVNEMDDNQLFVVMRTLYANQEELNQAACEALARRVYELSCQSDLNYFFGTGKQALLAYATLIPEELPD